MAIKLGELLVKEGLITAEQLDQALAHQKQHGGRLGLVLDELAIIKESEITDLLSRQYGIPSVDLEQIEIDSKAVSLVSAETAQKYQLIPLTIAGAKLKIAMVDPTNISALDDIKFMTGINVEPVLASETDVVQAIDKHYRALNTRQLLHDLDKLVETNARELEAVGIDLDESEKSTEEPAVVRLCNLILTNALHRSASEVHIESYEREYRIRFRIDGMLETVMNPPMRMRDAITRRFKLMARLDGSERHIPQRSGIRIRLKVEGKTRDAYFSVSILPTLWSEKIFLCVTDTEGRDLSLDELGFEPESLQRFDRALRVPGLVLVAGPMESGKTTTLYSALDRYNVSEVNIVTVEETIEHHLEGVNQVRVHKSEFPGTIGATLLEHPHILMVDQISDPETAALAMNAALQGPLVLSTMNANDTVTCVQRLVSFDVNLNLIAASLQCICAQKLVRKICEECRSPLETAESDLREIGFRAGEAENLQFYKGVGCKACDGSGYRGRTGLFEVLPVNDEIRDAIVRGLGVHEIRRVALANGLMTLRASGLNKIRQGITTADEAFRENLIVMRPDEERTSPGEFQRNVMELSVESKPPEASSRSQTKNLNKDRVVRAAEGYTRAGKLDNAVGEYEKWLTENPEDWNIIRQAGDLYARLNRIDMAILKYTRIAVHYEANGYDDRAIATYKAILRIAPSNVEALARLADLQVAHGHLPEAKKQYQSLADIYDREGRKKPATEVLKKLVELDPSDLSSRQKYVDFLGAHDEKEEAVNQLLVIADDLIQNELVPEAIPLLEKGLRIDGNHLQLRCKLAQAAIFENDAPRAIELLEEILENHPKDKNLLSVLGQAYEKSGKTEQAEAIGRQLAKSDSSDAGAT